VGEALYSSLAYVFALVWDDPEIGAAACHLIDEFAERLPTGTAASVPRSTYRLATETRSRGPWYTLLAGTEVVAGAPDGDRIAERLMWRVSADAVANCEQFLAVHAGAVSGPGDSGVLILGDSGAGKSTLVAALVQEGYGYLSDEAGVLDLRDGSMHPWPRPLGFEPGTRLLPRFAGIIDVDDPGEDGSRHVLANSLRAGAIGASCRVRHVIDYRYLAGSPTLIRPLSSGEAVVAMGRSTPSLRHQGQAGLELIARVAKRADRHRLVSGELEEAVNVVRQIVES
jgi:hypothetical protein